jgi:hypothetical protein
MDTLVAMLVVVEVYYWLWWLPRNWRRNREARELADGLRSIYGKGSRPLP